MPMLSDVQIDDIWAAFMRENTEQLTLSKSDLRDAFAAADTYTESVLETAFGVSALSALSALSERQKTDIFHRVIKKRLEVM